MFSVYATDLDVLGFVVRLPARADCFLFTHTVQTGPETHPAFCPICNVAPFPEDNAADYFRLAPR